jgi:hypothetical protein
MYENGRGVPKVYQEAVKWYRLAADQGDASAQNNLGVMYENGRGVPQDYKEAVKWYRLAADQGDASAQYNLGEMYENGRGVPQDYKEAVKWYRLAADQGVASAQYNLGVMYYEGRGVPQDYREAANWYRLAAEQGDAYAQNNLGVMYANGQGVPQDKVLAYAIYNRSAAGAPSSNNKATGNRDAIVKEMSPREIEAGQALTRELAQPGNFGKALEAYLKKAEAPQPVAPTPRAGKASAPKAGKVAKAPTASAADDLFPPAPARTPGRVSCSTHCINADCWRTYDDGRKVKLRAKSKWDPFENRFEWDAGPC